MNKARTSKLLMSVLALASVCSMIYAVPVQACLYGMTPGFWKNHHEYWPVGYLPGDSFQTVFGIVNDHIGPLAGLSLDDALRLGGGKGTDGAKKILARAAVALLLNEATFEPSGVPWVINHVINAFASEERDTILDLATEFDGYNNLGPPPGWP